MPGDLLRNAQQLIRQRGLDRTLIIDADVHHISAIKFLGQFMDPPWRRLFETLPVESLAPADPADRRVAGRIKRPPIPPPDGADPRRSARALVADLERIGVDYSVIFADDLLTLSLHPDRRFQAAVARGYARWLTECILPHEPRIKGMLYLPMVDADASLALIHEFGDAAGVVGFQVNLVGLDQFYADNCAKVYAALEERGRAVGFHSTGHWPRFPMFETFLGAHAISFPAFNAMCLINWLWSGMCERFPRLRCLFFEGGAAWIPMLMARLDRVYRMRPHEAPALRRLPSEYMREFFYTVQPLEQPESAEQLRLMFARIGAGQVLYASDYPHWDFDMPHALSRLSFLSQAEREAVLALNAVRAFGLRRDELLLADWKRNAAAERAAQRIS
jgi:predicted TIM-barrel fold metal-dependent hydrolase